MVYVEIAELKNTVLKQKKIHGQYNLIQDIELNIKFVNKDLHKKTVDQNRSTSQLHGVREVLGFRWHVGTLVTKLQDLSSMLYLIK